MPKQEAEQFVKITSYVLCSKDFYMFSGFPLRRVLEGVLYNYSGGYDTIQYTTLRDNINLLALEMGFSI